MTQDRDFKGVWIPKEIWLNNDLTLIEKVILIEIDSLDNENHCTASNEYLAQFCQCSEWKVSTAITKLTQLGLIEVVSFDGRHRVLKSCLARNHVAHVEEVKEEAKPAKAKAKKKTEAKTEEKPKEKRVSRKEQLCNYVESIDNFPEDIKKVLYDWIFSVGLPKGLTVAQLRDKLNKLYDECNDNDDLVKAAIEKAYLNNYFGFFKPTAMDTPIKTGSTNLCSKDYKVTKQVAEISF